MIDWEAVINWEAVDKLSPEALEQVSKILEKVITNA
jgi:hypothetical protein